MDFELRGEHSVVVDGTGFIGSHLVDPLIREDTRETPADAIGRRGWADQSHPPAWERPCG